MSPTPNHDSLDWADLAWQITCASGESFSVRTREPVSGGCIHQALRLRGERQSYFIKLNSADCAGMFEAEALGLQELRRCTALRVPEPVCWGRQGDHGYLVLEWLDLKPLAGKSEATLGEKLAELHHVTSALYGWSQDNTLGTTRQKNTPEGDWIHFWREHRLGFQLKLAQKKDARLTEPGERLLQTLEVLLAGHQPPASLLHGDLWSGNAAQDSQGKPVIFDPAVYYGDREAEIAMMELFGGFGGDALLAYRAAWPLEPGYVEVRRDLYQIYHILNHFNLFGGQYADQALLRMDRLLAAR
ncbi:MAG: fructosamine kinase family protein [Nevskiales bacterium]